MGNQLFLLSLSLIATVLFHIYRTILYPIFISPLSRVPNAHPVASFSSLWILWKRYKRQENEAIFNAHEKHGPIVRLGPNEISVNCVNEGLQKIYGGGFDKPNWYPDQFTCYG